MLSPVSAFLSRHLLDRVHGHRADALRRFAAKKASALRSPAERQKQAAEALAELLNHAARHVPRFKNLPALKNRISRETALSVLRDLPKMERSEIQDDLSLFVSDTANSPMSDATGGSTGTPMIFRIDRSTQLARESSIMWADSLAGWQPGEKIAMLWGSDKDVKSVSTNWRMTLRWWIENRRWYNAFEMGENRMEDYHRDLSRFAPHLLTAYAGAVYALAKYLLAKKITPYYPLKSIVSSAEVLTPDMRREVEQVFQKPVFDRYGNREFGAIAAECRVHDGLHINENDMILEIDSPDAARIPGCVLITYLHNYAMPFIRYNTGDMAMISEGGPCACGRTTKRLNKVLGRRSDMIRAADGTLIHGEYFTHLFYGAPHIRQFQFVQEGTSRFVLYLAADPSSIKHLEPEWRAKILERVGRESELAIRYVNEIPPLPSGKYKFTVSKLSC